MQPEYLSLVFIVVIVLLGSAFCSSYEAAFFTVNRLKIETLASSGSKSAKNLLELKNQTGDVIGSLVIMNNLFNITGSIIIGNFLAELFGSLIVGILSGVFTFLVILFGEVLPKNAGERAALDYSLALSGFVLVLIKILKPLTLVFNTIAKLIFGPRVETFTTSEEEIKYMVDLGLKHNSIESGEQQMIQNVFKLDDKSAKEIMTPRVNIVALDAGQSIGKQKKVLYDSNHSRLPVYDEDFDTITGFVLLRDCLEKLSRDKNDTLPSEILNPIPVAKENTKVDKLLVMFKKSTSHIILVQDEFGGTSGIVTLEDVLEELVGEIMDETDQVVDMRNVEV